MKMIIPMYTQEKSKKNYKKKNTLQTKKYSNIFFSKFNQYRIR
jgi:hypothetical protein